MSINYTFIIPHKDSQSLLYRCIESIPIRNDIEIIVVDDNSIDKTFDLNFLKRHNVSILLLTQSRTAGGARNEGLKKAKGKWLLFADADDFYESGFIDELDKKIETDNDIVYFDFYKRFNVETCNSERNPYSVFLREYAQNPNNKFYNNAIRYSLNAAWKMMFKHSFIKKESIEFEEVSSGNDVYFTYTASNKARKIDVILAKLYYWTYNPQSITHKSYDLIQLKNNILNIARHDAFLIEQNAWLQIRLGIGGKSFLKKYGIKITLAYNYNLIRVRKSFFKILAMQLYQRFKIGITGDI